MANDEQPTVGHSVIVHSASPQDAAKALSSAYSIASKLVGAETSGSALPTEAQTVLLHAALNTGGEGSRHFEAWTGMVDFEGALDEGSYNILPMVWQFLADQKFAHKLMPRLLGIYRNNWVKATRRSVIAEGALRALRHAGVPTLCVKGLPLAFAHYAKPALRPMNDIDIVVPPDLVPLASDVLQSTGFQPAPSNWQVDRLIRHAWQHNHPDGGELDLHWHVLFECPQKSADAHFWDAAIPLGIGAESSLQLCATDLLIHVIVHGIRWNPHPPMRWIADAAIILRSNAAIDWSRLAAYAERFQLGQRIGLGLDILKSDFQLPVPGDIIRSLSKRTSFIERMEMATMRGADERSLWRHARRGTYVLRMMRGEKIRDLPGALAGEVWRRGQRKLAGQG